MRRGLRRRAAWALALGLTAALGFCSSALSQVPDVPSGPVTLRGRVTHPRPDANLAGLEVALYSLAGDGSPGVRGSQTDSEGRFVFEGISQDPQIVFLAGVRFGGVPFGKRLKLSSGQTQAEVVVEVRDTTATAAGIRVSETQLRVRWLGANLRLKISTRMHNPSDEVVFVPIEAREATDAPFVAALPAAASDVATGFGGIGEGWQHDGSRLFYWGPLYPGDQEITYQYLIPIDSDELTLRKSFPSGSEFLSVLTPTDGLELSGPGLVSEPHADEPFQLDGVAMNVLTADEVAPGDEIVLQIALPATRVDDGALALKRADHWLELDGTALVVSVEHRLEVEPGTRLRARPDEPLYTLATPAGAELLGVMPNADAVGLRTVSDEAGTRLEVSGPLSPGETVIAARYRLPVTGEVTSLDLRVSRPAAVFNVMVADTGVVIETSRLHRLRPFRSGTRMYLQREAFDVRPDETVSLVLRPIERDGLRQPASLAVILAVALAAVWIVVAPLRTPPGEHEADRERGALELERMRVYADIRDLEHDHDTRKLAADDYQRMRGDLRARAVDLLRRERSGEASDATTAAAAAPVPPSDEARPAAADAAGGRSCSSCGARVKAGWQFCASCGGTLEGLDPTAESTG